MLRKPSAPVKRVKPPAQAVNLARSASGRPSSSQITDKRQFAREAFDEIGWTSFGKQFIGERVADGLDMRLHVEHGAAAEGFVDDVAQPFVIGLVHRQHAVGERPHNARHPPLQSGDVAVLPADGERIGVLQDLIGERLRGTWPRLCR